MKFALCSSRGTLVCNLPRAARLVPEPCASGIFPTLILGARCCMRTDARCGVIIEPGGPFVEFTSPRITEVDI
jgi:hypothetical protein